MKHAFQWIRILELSLILLAVMIVAVSVGSADLSVIDSLKIMLSRIPILGDFVDISNIGTTYETIVWNVRMPRIILSALVGGALAIVGGVFQGVFGNSLADPHILGVSSGAALGATIAMLSGLSVNFLGLGVIGAFSFVGALVTVFVVYNVARVGREISPTNMILTGTATSMMLSAVISLLMTFNKEKIGKVYMWTMGSFSAASWTKICFVLIALIVAACVFILYSNKLNVIMLGDEEAKALGVDTGKARKILIAVASVLVAAAVSVSGVIGFVGLIIPHVVRLLGGANNKKLLPYSMLCGAIFMVICDTLARTITAPTEIPVGIITSIFGAPFFVFILIRNKRKI